MCHPKSPDRIYLPLINLVLFILLLQQPRYLMRQQIGCNIYLLLSFLRLVMKFLGAKVSRQAAGQSSILISLQSYTFSWKWYRVNLNQSCTFLGRCDNHLVHNSQNCLWRKPNIGNSWYNWSRLFPTFISNPISKELNNLWRLKTQGFTYGIDRGASKSFKSSEEARIKLNCLAFQISELKELNWFGRFELELN